MLKKASELWKNSEGRFSKVCTLCFTNNTVICFMTSDQIGVSVQGLESFLGQSRG